MRFVETHSNQRALKRVTTRKPAPNRLELVRHGPLIRLRRRVSLDFGEDECAVDEARQDLPGRVTVTAELNEAEVLRSVHVAEGDDVAGRNRENTVNDFSRINPSTGRGLDDPKPSQTTEQTHDRRGSGL